MEPEAYERTAVVEEHHWWFEEMRAVWQGLLRRAPRVPERLRALDAGCGTGGNLQALGRSGSAIGLDLSSLALSLARRKSSAPLVRGSIGDLPFRDGSFDLILCTDVLYHASVLDEEAALREMRRVLRSGGILLVTVPAFDSLRSAHDRAVHSARRYTRGRLRSRLTRAGFRPIRISYWNGLLLLPIGAYRKAFRRAGSRCDLDLPSLPLNALLRGIARIDAALALRGLLPAGLSVAALACREEE